jgi:hypothetical protein
MNKLSAIPPRPSRMSAKLRNAIHLHVQEGKTILAACKEAGMSPQGFHKAMKRPTVRDYLQKVQAEFVTSVESKRALHRARAFEVGLDLMINSKSEAIRARMVEFFAGEAKQAAQVQVNVDARSGGYEFVRPGQQLVEIKGGEG